MLEDGGLEKLDRQKQQAVQEIYQTMGITAVIQFGKAVDALAEVGDGWDSASHPRSFLKLLPAYERERNLWQHRTIWQEHLAKDFASYESYKRAEYCMYSPFYNCTDGAKNGRRPQTQLCGDAPIFYSNLVSAFLSTWNRCAARARPDIGEAGISRTAAVSCAFNQALLDVLPVYLPGQAALFWQQIKVPPCHQIDAAMTWKPSPYTAPLP